MLKVSPGKYIAAVVPALDQFLLFHVKSVSVAGDGKIRYGPIPGAEVIQPESVQDIYPNNLNQWTLSADSVAGLEGLSGQKKGYIFYIDKTKPDILYKYRMHVFPEILKNTVYYPVQLNQSLFQDRSFQPVDDMGTFSGDVEILQLANCIVGFQTTNPLNVPLRTMINIEYVQYNVRQVTSVAEAEAACAAGVVVPEVLPIYQMSSYLENDVLDKVYGNNLFDNSMLDKVHFRWESEGKESFLLSLYGETDGSNTSGQFTLQSDTFDGTVDVLEIPKGAKLKIWSVEVDGSPCTATIGVQRGTTVTPVMNVTLPSPGAVVKEYRSRPVLIDCSQLDDRPAGLVISWNQATAAKSSVVVTAELSY